ncbi:hypothetical protein LR010_01830 [Candidatus Gracilibacteria bacterium]|nr:hypothetical protein [Candidatus Gracilibacteria bacterium]
MVKLSDVSYNLDLSTQANANFEDRFPKVYGRKLGILTEDETNIPVRQPTVIWKLPEEGGHL